jgi:hypothetical protein
MHERRYEDLRQSTYGLVFFGTPHQGGNGVSYAKIIANSIRMITRQSKSSLLKNLKRGSLLNEATTDQFRGQLGDYEVLTFFESIKTPLTGIFGWATKYIVSSCFLPLGKRHKI